MIATTVILKCSKLLRIIGKIPIINLRHFSKMASNGESLKPLVGVCQMTSTSNKADNFRICQALIERAKKRGVEV